MNAIWKPTDQQRRTKRRKRRLLAGALLLSLAAGITILLSGRSGPLQNVSAAYAPETRVSAEVSLPFPAATEKNPQQPHPLSHTISDGDNLSAIFDSFKINQGVLFQIIAADESLLALDILRPGNRLTFTLDEENGQLNSMELFINPAHRVVYRRLDKDVFESEEIIIPGIWTKEIIEGEIKDSFFLSAMLAGLSRQEAGNITDLYKGKLDFSRDMRSGDHFQVVRSLQSVDGALTGQSQIEAIRIYARQHCYSAFLFEDGNYYDENGDSLARAFRRYPFQGRYRVSSAYNLRRVHPVTHRISPHRGVDFGMPVGTPILATADGEVTRVKNHPFAGKYIEIRHDGQYLTRYLHLSRIKVNRGQKVKRGQVIASSGNTGRSTGPHLHYELHVKGRAVNPLTAAIPLRVSVPKEQATRYRQRVSELTALLEKGIWDPVGA